MRRWTTAVLLVLATWGFAVGVAGAQTSLVAGGLTALPAVRLGPNLVRNGGFETLSGSVPADWTTGSGWGVDQLMRRAGSLSYRRTTGGGTVAQTVQLRKGVYRFSAWVRRENLGTGSTSGFRLQVDFRPAVSEWMTTEVISGTGDWTRYEVKNIVVPEDRRTVLKLENYGGPAGTVWFDDVNLEEQLPQPVDVFLLYPNYRGMLFDDGPQQLRLDVTVTPPGDDFGRHTVRGTLKDEATGQVVAARDYPAAAHLVVELDGSLMQYGRPYLATVALVDGATGGASATYPAYRVSRVAAATRQAMNIAVDTKNRLLVKGQPRFVLGVYDSGGGYSTSDATWENALWSPTGSRRLDGLKINFYLNYWMGEAPADAMKALMTNLQKRGVMYLQTGNCFDRFPAGSNFLINSSDAYVRDIGAHPGSAGYYTIDECRSELAPGAFNQHVRLRSLDPDSMTFAALFGNPDIVFWRDAADVLASDPYPMFSAEPAGGYNHRQVADWTARTREAVKDARPIMTVLQFFKFTSRGRWPTRQEMRNHAAMAIVEGAQGLWWWAVGNGAGALAALCSDWCAERTAHMNDLKAVVGELAALEPVLLADDTPGALRGNTDPTAIRTKVKVVGDRGYVFAYNNANRTASATFTWNTAPGTVTVNAENRTLTVSGSAFTDTFGPYQAHIYVIGTGGTGGGGGNSGGPGGLTIGFANPVAGATVSGTTTVTMTASGGSDFTYSLAVNGTHVYTGANNGFSWNTATVANGPYTLTATVRDAAGRTGTASRTVTVANSTGSPAGPLRVIFTSPSAGATVSGSVTTNVWVEGQSGASNTFALSVDGQSVGTMTTSGTHAAFAWDTRKVTDGAHTLTATVKDATGQTGTGSRSVRTSNGVTSSPTPGLTVSFTSPAAAATVSGTTPVSMSASGGSGFIYNLAVDGTPVYTGADSRFDWNTAAVANDTHTLTATVTDASGKTGTATRTVNVSNTVAPAGLRAIMTSPRAGATVSGNVTVNVWVEGASGASNAFTLTVDGKVVGAQTISGAHVWFSWPSTGVTNGTHTLSATVKDAAGRTGSTSLMVTVRN